MQDLPSEWPGALAHESGRGRAERTHAVHLTSGSRLARACGAGDIAVNSMHHQALARVADGLSAVAHAPDAVVEGIESTTDDWWMLGVQWHPEELVDTVEPWDRAIFAAFAEAAHAYALSADGASVPRS